MISMIGEGCFASDETLFRRFLLLLSRFERDFDNICCMIINKFHGDLMCNTDIHNGNNTLNCAVIFMRYPLLFDRPSDRPSFFHNKIIKITYHRS